jgi:hypothetical protein
MERVLDSHRLSAVISDCNRSANKTNHPIQNPLLFVTEHRTRDVIFRVRKEHNFLWDMRFPWPWIRTLPYSWMLRHAIWYTGAYISQKTVTSIISSLLHRKARLQVLPTTLVRKYHNVRCQVPKGCNLQHNSLFVRLWTSFCLCVCVCVCVCQSGIWPAAPIFKVEDAGSS